ncbi:uncharacterized protein KY384_007238 [Bacidia gigantensis]|uniref:uncharacterized protein n=1 Tax=Bacidia gigantensis TaxID=2732470 RepID=UPI001D040503|nr:uncharacterized protein KY384_007238 [Bacidia gigantensis]KAG8528321.1 hypothetical protein KY384_007238 [Bacidia gigantensis]
MGEGEGKGAGADERVCREGYMGWKEVLGRSKTEGGTRHAWVLPSSSQAGGDRGGEGRGVKEDVYTHVKLLMYPDGGIARFRLYGRPVVPEVSTTGLSGRGKEVELSAALNGGTVVDWSDQHFGHARNLLLPGRGKDMGDGWETKRSREKGHVDWVVVRLEARGKVGRVVVDTMHFRGNFPRGVRVLGTDEAEGNKEEEWTELGKIEHCEKDKEHEILVEGEKAVSLVKMIIEPDGGVKRLRVFGTRV